LLRDVLPGNKEKLFGYSFGEAIREMYLDDVIEREEFYILKEYVDGKCFKYSSKNLVSRLKFLDELIEKLQ